MVFKIFDAEDKSKQCQSQCFRTYVAKSRISSPMAALKGFLLMERSFATVRLPVEVLMAATWSSLVPSSAGTNPRKNPMCVGCFSVILKENVQSKTWGVSVIDARGEEVAEENKNLGHPREAHQPGQLVLERLNVSVHRETIQRGGVKGGSGRGGDAHLSACSIVNDNE